MIGSRWGASALPITARPPASASGTLPDSSVRLWVDGRRAPDLYRNGRLMARSVHVIVDSVRANNPGQPISDVLTADASGGLQPLTADLDLER